MDGSPDSDGADGSEVGPAPEAAVPAPDAEAFFDRVGTLPLYALSTRGESAFPGYWAGFRPGPGGGSATRLTFNQAWDDQGGVFVFCGTDPTIGPDADPAAAFLERLGTVAKPGVRMLWIADPSQPTADWIAHALPASRMSGVTWATTEEARFDLGGYRLLVPRGTQLSPPAPGNQAPVVVLSSGAGPLNLVAPNGRIYFTAAQRCVFLLYGPTVGCFFAQVSVPSPTGPAPDGFVELGVQLRYALPDPDDPSGRAVRTVPMPIIYQGTNPVVLHLTVDPALPLAPARTWLGFFTDTQPPGLGPFLDTTLRTTHGHPIRLAPITRSGRTALRVGHSSVPR